MPASIRRTTRRDLVSGDQGVRIAPLVRSQERDPLFSSVVLLAQARSETNGATTFVDRSSYARTLTANGGVAWSTSVTRFSRASIAVDGTGDYVTAADATELELSNSNFSIEVWLEPFTQSRQFATLISRQQGGGLFTTGGWTLLVNNASATAGDIAFYAANFSPSTSLMATTGVNVRDGLPHFIHLQRYNNFWSIYVDGVPRAGASWSGTVAGLTTNICLFSDLGGFATRDLSGNIGSLRWTMGQVRNTIEVPTRPFPTR